jgi:N-acetyltransferase
VVWKAAGVHHDLQLVGPEVVLAPLGTEHAGALAELGDADAYAWHTSARPLTAPAARAEIERLVESPTVQPFAVLGTDDGELRGITCFYDYLASVPRVEIGYTFYGRRFWGGLTNPAAKLLMLSHAFDTWRCARVALRCDAANLRSAGAIQRLGARPEGILRAHRRRHDGTVADTAYFSIIGSEWPSVRRGLLERVGE